MIKVKTAIEKGKQLENFIADQIKAKGLDDKACRSHGSGNGNREKADISTSLTILGRNVGIEAKNHKVPHIKDWWEQTQKLETLDREPVLVYKLYGESMEESKAVVYLDTLLNLIRNQKTPKDYKQPIQTSLNPQKPNIALINQTIDTLKRIKNNLS